MNGIDSINVDDKVSWKDKDGVRRFGRVAGFNPDYTTRVWWFGMTVNVPDRELTKECG